jgi:WD40 repeat protein
MTQYNISEKFLEKDYGECFRGVVKSMCVSRDSAFLYSSDASGSYKKFSVLQKKLLKEHRPEGKENSYEYEKWPSDGFEQIVVGEGEIWGASTTGVVGSFSANDTVYHHKWGCVFDQSHAEACENLPNEYNLNFDKDASCCIISVKSEGLDPQKAFIVGQRCILSLDLTTLTKGDVVKHNIHTGILTGYCTNDNYLFTCDSSGELKQWSLENFSMKKDYSPNQTGLTRKIACTRDNRYLFTSNLTGDIHQYDVVSNFCFLKTYEKCHKADISAMVCTADSRYLITASRFGRIRQFTLINNGFTDFNQIELTHEYKQLNSGAVSAICCTNDFKFMFTGDTSGTLTQYSLILRDKMCTFSSIGKKPITALLATEDNRFVFLGSAGGFFRRFNIRGQSIVQDYGSVHSARICSISQFNDQGYILTADNQGHVFQFEEGRFTSGPSSISNSQDYLVPLCVNYFNFEYDMNFLSSMILNKLYNRKLTSLRDFISEQNYEICVRYANCGQYSAVDIIVMLMAYSITDQVSRLPYFLKAINSNNKVTRKDMDGLIYYVFVAMESKGNMIGTKVIESLFEYEYRKVTSFVKGSAELTKKGTIVSDCCIDRSNTEYLHKEIFKLPKTGTPMLNVEVYKWSIRWNKKRPGDELYMWLDYLRDGKNLTHKVALSDKKSIKIINQLWSYYKTCWYIKFALNLFLFIALWVEGSILNQAGKKMLVENVGLESMVNIVGLLVIVLCGLLLTFNVCFYLGSKDFWKQFNSWVGTIGY